MKYDRNQHHLIWSKSSGQVEYFISGKITSESLPHFALRELLAQNTGLASSIYAILNGASRRLSRLKPEILKTYESIQCEEVIHRNQKRAFFQFASRNGVPDYLRLIAKNIDLFSEVVTADFKKLLIKGNFNPQGCENLLFHTANPDFYLWIPKNYQSNQVLICFGNFGNGLNIPYPLAHHILLEQKKAILYLYRHEKPSLDAFFVSDTKIKDDVKIINDLLSHYGLTKRYGLGTSLGGYLVCKYAQSLDLMKVVNFSGSPGKLTDQSMRQDPPSNWLNKFSPNLVMTVFSKNDPVDKRIYASYKHFGLKTNEWWMNDGSHGSFLSAYLDNQLTSIFDWLFN